MGIDITKVNKLFEEKMNKEVLENNKELIKKYYVSKKDIEEKLLKPIQEEGQKTYDEFMDKNNKDFEIAGAILQELGHIEGIIIEILEGK